MSATTTITASTSASPSSTTSTEATFRSLYPRAARSFLSRDFPQTHALITSAFQLIPPSTSTDPTSQLGVWRRKWDILRITLETNVYSTPPSEAEELPSPIRANLMLSPQSLLASLHARSLKLFTPKAEGSDGDTGSKLGLSSRYLPPQVIVTLVLASMKLNVPEVGKGMVEDWLSGRGDLEKASSEDEDGYEKIVELYCLELLPRLEEWDLAAEFLQYEGELNTAKKQKLVATLDNNRSALHSSRHRSRTPSTPALSPSRSRSQSRPSSPTGSSSSQSSEKTETPITARFKFAKAQEDARLNANVRKPFDPLAMSTISVPSSLSGSTDTSRTATPVPIPAPAPTPISTNGKSKYKIRHSTKSTVQKQDPTSPQNTNSGALPVPPLISDPSPLPSSSSSGKLATSSYPQGPVAFIRSGFYNWKACLLSAKPGVGTILFAVAAVIGFIHYVRTRRRLRAASRSPASTMDIGVKEEGLAHLASIGGQLIAGSNKNVVDEVKRRLTIGREQRSTGLLGGLWDETKRAIGDTIQMAGQGLV